MSCSSSCCGFLSVKRRQACHCSGKMQVLLITQLTAVSHSGSAAPEPGYNACWIAGVAYWDTWWRNWVVTNVTNHTCALLVVTCPTGCCEMFLRWLKTNKQWISFFFLQLLLWNRVGWVFADWHYKLGMHSTRCNRRNKLPAKNGKCIDYPLIIKLKLIKRSEGKGLQVLTKNNLTRAMKY